MGQRIARVVIEGIWVLDISFQVVLVGSLVIKVKNINAFSPLTSLNSMAHSNIFSLYLQYRWIQSKLQIAYESGRKETSKDHLCETPFELWLKLFNQKLSCKRPLPKASATTFGITRLGYIPFLVLSSRKRPLLKFLERRPPFFKPQIWHDHIWL